MEFLEELPTQGKVIIKQRFELAEIIGFETRNKYVIENSSGTTIGFAAEQQKGILGFLFRQFLGHWRRFNIYFFNNNRQVVFKTRHPFRFFFQRLEIEWPDGRRIGALQQRFSILGKKFDVENANGVSVLKMKSPLWRIWTFRFYRRQQQVALITKEWSGILTEMMTDKDKFTVEFQNSQLTPEERILLTAAAVFVDLQYFERKAD